jgi:hypothetical protein
MKGPYERLKYDLRRFWECPQCQRRQRTDGTVTGLICDCQLAVEENQRVSMRLSHDDIRRSSVKQPQPSTLGEDPPVEAALPPEEPATADDSSVQAPTPAEPAREEASTGTVAATPEDPEEPVEATATESETPTASENPTISDAAATPENTPGSG